jgi:thioredoxin-related protein
MSATRRSTLPIILLLGLAAAVSAAAAEPDNRAVEWLTYREAMDRGAGLDRPILLHFTASYSSLCRKMKRETYRDRRVIRYLNENFAAAMVDIEQLPSLARKFDVEALPTVWFLDASGKPLTAVAGEVGPDKMLRITEYVREKIYEHTDYQTWLDKRHGR